MSKSMSLKARIKNMASENHIPAQAVLQNFMLEIISLSKYKENVVLKGGMLIASLVETNAHRITQLDQVLHAISFETSSEATARISHHLKIQISPDTIPRIFRKTIFGHIACPCVLGVDDCVLKRGQNYGTLLIDLETQKAIDHLQRINSAVLGTWLNDHTAV